MADRSSSIHLVPPYIISPCTAPECLLAISRYLHQMQRQNSCCCCNAFHGVNNSLHQLQHQSSVLTSLSWSRPLHEAAGSSDPIMIAAVVQMTAVEVDSGQDVCCSIQSITTLTSPGAGVKHADMLVPGSNVSNGPPHCHAGNTPPTLMASFIRRFYLGTVPSIMASIVLRSLLFGAANEP